MISEKKNIKTAVILKNQDYFEKLNNQQIAIKNKNETIFCVDFAFDFKNTKTEVFEKSILNMIDLFLQGENCTLFIYGQNEFKIEDTFIEEILHEILNRKISLKMSILSIEENGFHDILPKKAKSLPSIIEVSGIIKPFDLETCKLDNIPNLLAKMSTFVQKIKEHVVLELTKDSESCQDQIFFRIAVMKNNEKTSDDLLALEVVIKSLHESSIKGIVNPKINYKLSKLTHYLKDSLGGNSNSLMLAVVPSISLDMDLTQNILELTVLSKEIKNFIIRSYEKSIFVNSLFQVSEFIILILICVDYLCLFIQLFYIWSKNKK